MGALRVQMCNEHGRDLVKFLEFKPCICGSHDVTYEYDSAKDGMTKSAKAICAKCGRVLRSWTS